MSAAAVHRVPACDPWFEATRPDRGPVTHVVVAEHKPERDCEPSKIAVSCYNEMDIARAKQEARDQKMIDIRVLTAAEWKDEQRKAVRS